MGYTTGFDHPRAFESDGFGPQMLEQSDTPSEQDGHQVDVYLVKKSGSDALLGDTSRAYGDVLVPRDRSCLLDGALDTTRDERERRSFGNLLLWNRMANNKDRYVQGVSVLLVGGASVWGLHGHLLGIVVGSGRGRWPGPRL